MNPAAHQDLSTGSSISVSCVHERSGGGGHTAAGKEHLHAAVHVLAGDTGSGPSKCSVYEETQSLCARHLIHQENTIKMYVRFQ